MMQIIAEQMIYASVNSRFSPANPVGRSGYQVVHRSDGLSNAEAELLTQFVASCDGELPSVRWQYRLLPDQRCVVARTEYAPPVNDICDGRGTLLSHCLIVSQEDFASVKNSPFALIDAFPTLAGLDEMISRFGIATGAAPTAQLQIGDGPDSALQPDAHPSRFGQLVTLAFCAQELVASDRHLNIFGPKEQAEGLLRVAFSLLPPASRIHCTFDTHADGIRTGSDCWAACRKEQNTVNAALNLNAESGQLATDWAEPSRQVQSMYSQWLLHALSSNAPIQATMCLAPEAQGISDAIACGRPLCLDDYDDAFLDAFATCNKDKLLRLFHERLIASTSGRIADDIREAFLLERPPRDLLMLTCDAVASAAMLNHWHLQLVDASDHHWQQDDWDALQRSAKLAQDGKLLFLCAVLRPKTDCEARRLGLAILDPMEFEELCEAYRDRVPCSSFVSEEHFTRLAAEPWLSEVSSPELLELWNTAILCVPADQLVAIERTLAYMDRRDLRKLRKKLARADKCPLPLSNAVNRHFERREGGPSILDRILPWRLRSKDRDASRDQ